MFCYLHVANCLYIKGHGLGFTYNQALVACHFTYWLARDCICLFILTKYCSILLSCLLLVFLLNRLQAVACKLAKILPVLAVFWPISCGMWKLSSYLSLAISMHRCYVFLLQVYLCCFRPLCIMWSWFQVCHTSPALSLWTACSLGTLVHLCLLPAPKKLLLFACPLPFSLCWLSWHLRSEACSSLICINFCPITWVNSRIFRSLIQRCWQLQSHRRPGTNLGRFTTFWRGWHVLRPTSCLADAPLMYMALITREAQRNGGDEWRSYDTIFHQNTLVNKNLDWFELDSGLYKSTFVAQRML